MKIDTEGIISITDANQNFSRAAHLADKLGTVIIFKTNTPKYKLVELSSDDEIEMTDDEKIDFVAARVLREYREAFEELAK